MMFNPAMLGINPQIAEQAREVGQHLRMEITKYRREGRLEIRYILADPNEDIDVGVLVDKLADQIAWGFATMFDIKGKIKSVG